jgi:hypothetical protein
MITEKEELYTPVDVKYGEENNIFKDYSDGYALIFRFSEKIFKPVADVLNSINDKFWDEVLEARIFTSEKELHIFETDGRLKAVEIKDGNNTKGCISNENQAIKRYEINDGNKCLVVKEYLGYDDDGQMFVSLTRLCGVEKKGETD